MDTFYWSTEYEHSDNTHTMSEFLEKHMDSNWELIEHDGSMATIKVDGVLWAAHASGNGDFKNHKVDFEDLRQETKYRTISDGYKEYLQYERKTHFLFIFTVYKWTYIWRPYYDQIWGRSLDTTCSDTYICSYNTYFKDFIEKYPHIEDYFTWADEEQKRLEHIANEEKKEIEEKKDTVKYL